MRPQIRQALTKTTAALAAVLCVAGAATVVGAAAVADARVEAQPTAAPSPPVPEAVPTVPQWKLVKTHERAVRAERRVRALKRTLATGPDFDVSLQLAAIVYGQDPRHLKACALSEGHREAFRYQRHNRVSNRGGSGAHSSFQFMAGTFLSTPFARLPRDRADVQAFAAAWMWSRGRRHEWTGRGC